MKGILRVGMWALLTIIIIAILAELVLLLLLKQNVDNYKYYWISESQKPAPADSLLYVALGDSSAQGLGATRPEKGYVGLVAASLKEKTNKPVQIVNLSVTGARVQDVLETQLPQLDKLKINNKTVVTLAIGANDMSIFQSAAFESQMDELLERLPKQTVVADVAYFGGGRKRNLEKNALKANEIIAELTKKYNLKLAPLHGITQQRDSLWTMSADLLHPSNKGYRNWYEAFRQALDL